jgi:hypothetical protein
LKEKNGRYAEQLDWLLEQREAGRFIPMANYVTHFPQVENVVFSNY